MSLIAALQGLAGAGVFASRAFLPLFVVALVARFPELVSWLPFVEERPVAVSPHLGWLVSDAALAVLGLLAIAEIRIDKSAELRELLSDVEPWLKGAVAVLATFGLLDAQSRGLIEQLVAPPAGLLATPGGHAAALGFAVVVGLIVLAAARLRARMLDHVEVADPDDALGLRRFTSALEDLWAAGGILLVILAPIVAFAVAAAALALVAWADRRLEARAEAQRSPCPSCGEPLRPEAGACSSCGTPRPALSEPSTRAWPDRWLSAGDPRADRALELLAQGRCPACAERRDPRALLGRSPHGCRWPAETAAAGGVGGDWPARLDAHLRRRTALLAAFAFLLGWLPILGAVAALVLGRLRVGVPYRRFLGFGGRFGARWTARGLTFLLVLFSGVPVVSVLAAPALVVIQRLAFRRAFLRTAA